MHIVYITREYPPTLRGGGIASYVREMARALHDRGHQVTVICASDDTRLRSEENDRGVRVLRLDKGDFVIPSVEGGGIWKKFRIFYRFPSYRRRIARTLEELKDVDVVEVPEYGAEARCLLGGAWPVVIRLHCPLSLSRATRQPRKFKCWQALWAWLGRQERETVNRARFVSSCSAGLAEWVARYFGTDRGKIETIYNPVDLSEWEFHPSPADSPSVLFVGTVAEGKGAADLIEAVKLLRRRGIPATVTLAGKLGVFGSRLREALMGEGWCRFLGQVDRSHVRELFSAYSVVCLPSWWENMPMACIEAMACGCIVIGSSSGGMSEIITDGEDGFLCPPRRPQLLAQTLTEALGLPPDRRRLMAERARNRIEQEFGMQAVIPRMTSYYQHVVNLHKHEHHLDH